MGPGGPSGPRQSGPPSDEGKHPRIVDEQHLKDMETLVNNDEGWASMQDEVDYSERLVFSDEEESGDKSGGDPSAQYVVVLIA